MIDDELLAAAQKTLEGRLAALNMANFRPAIHRDVSFREIRAGLARRDIRNWIRPLLGQSKGGAAIYRLTVNAQAGADKLQRAFGAFSDAFELRDNHVLTRNNAISDSTTVYVGSSRDVGSRLHQHLYKCARGTYALKLHLWCPDADHSLKVEVVPISERDAVNAHLVQDVEDALWARSRPMFGKLGAK